MSRLRPVLMSLLFPLATLVFVTAPASAGIITPLPDIPDTAGISFWVTFPDLPAAVGPDLVAARYLYVSPTADGSVTVSDADGSNPITTNFTKGTITTLPFPDAYVAAASDGIEDAAARITSTVPISVYASAILDAASTGFQALPDDALGTSHRVLGYTALAGFGASRLTVIGTASGTTVTVTPHSTIDGRPAGVPFAIALDEGQTYQLSSLTDGADVTGTTVTSDKPVAVLGGAACANVPVGSYACNPLVQQLPPTTAWGTDFVTTRFATRTKGDTYRILADQDATSVSINGAQVAMLDAGEFHETIQPADATTTANDAIVFTASKPVMVAQYGNGQGYDNTTGDPLMMLVTPVGQHLTSYTVATPAIVSSGVEMTPYVNVVVQTRDVGKLTLDGAVVPADQFVSAAGTDYSVAQLQVSTGQHDLTSVHQFGVQVYLWGPYDGLAFPGGSASAPIADANDPPTASPLTSTGQGPRTVTVPVAEQQEVHLLDGSTVVDEVTIAGQGSYVLDPSTGVITFTPEAGFAGAATPVTYRIADAWNQQAESTFTPTVQASPSQVVPAPPAANPRADLQVPKRAIVSPGKAGAVTARCIVRDAMINDCSVTLVARVKGKRTVIGTGVSKATAPGRIRVRLNAVGRSLTASPNGQRTTAQMTVRTTAGQTLHDDATLRVVTRSFTLSRPAYFSSSSTRLAKADRAYLRRVGDAVGTVRRITCTGYTDSSGSERSNKVLGLKRAKAVCAALDLPRGVRVDIVSAGEHRPVAANSGAAGKARNRRATITLHY